MAPPPRARGPWLVVIVLLASAPGATRGEQAPDAAVDDASAPDPSDAQPPPTSGIRCTTLRYAFQPQCFDPPCPDVKRKLGDRLDLGPQVAVWIEAPDRSRFHDTLMLTNLTAKHGVGNRPGLAHLPSGPKHPYGKRLMALPVWAWSRGKLYPQVIMQDGHEEWMGFHESISTPDPYYCRPMEIGEVDVDAVTCPTKVFNSAKGRLAPELPSIPYPPRNDLLIFGERDCDQADRQASGCVRSAEMFKSINDLDAVAAATPTFNRPYEGRWTLSPMLAPDRDYALMVEVNREFDQNSSHRYPAYVDKMLTENGFTQTGLGNNLGQPSVVYRVPFRIDGQQRIGSTEVIVGYGSPDGTSGMLRAPDSTISQSPGSGEGRLATIAAPWKGLAGETLPEAKVFLKVEDCAPTMDSEGACKVRPPAPPAVTDMSAPRSGVTATTAQIEFRHSGDEGAPVVEYDIRRHTGAATEENFLEGVPLERVDPGPPGTMTTFTVRDLKPNTDYTVAIRAVGRCGTLSPLVQVGLTTADQRFTQLTGCFVATAAYGSALAPAVAAMRGVRDRARAASPLGAAAVDLYERSSPPLAGALRGSEALRAMVRTLLAPVAATLP